MGIVISSFPTFRAIKCMVIGRTSSLRRCAARIKDPVHRIPSSIIGPFADTFFKGTCNRGVTWPRMNKSLRQSQRFIDCQYQRHRAICYLLEIRISLDRNPIQNSNEDMMQIGLLIHETGREKTPQLFHIY